MFHQTRSSEADTNGRHSRTGVEQLKKTTSAIIQSNVHRYAIDSKWAEFLGWVCATLNSNLDSGSIHRKLEHLCGGEIGSKRRMHTSGPSCVNPSGNTPTVPPCNKRVSTCVQTKCRYELTVCVHNKAVIGKDTWSKVSLLSTDGFNEYCDTSTTSCNRNSQL